MSLSRICAGIVSLADVPELCGPEAGRLSAVLLHGNSIRSIGPGAFPTRALTALVRLDLSSNALADMVFAADLPGSLQVLNLACNQYVCRVFLLGVQVFFFR
jgi:hypothetical protein